jgi:hypothetical protein
VPEFEDYFCTMTGHDRLRVAVEQFLGFGLCQTKSLPVASRQMRPDLCCQHIVVFGVSVILDQDLPRSPCHAVVEEILGVDVLLNPTEKTALLAVEVFFAVRLLGLVKSGSQFDV